MEYFALFEPAAEGGFVITFPDFGWGVSQGDTERDANEMAAALLQTIVQEHIRNGEPLPKARKRRGRNFRPVALPALQAAKARLYREFCAAGIRKAELARRLKIPQPNIDRLFDLGHNSRLDLIDSAFRALGKQLVIDVQDAA